MISRDEVQKVAHLARISLKEQEVEQLQGDLSKILDYIDKLNTLDVSDVPPTSHPLQLKNIYRADLVKPSFSQEQALKFAIESKNGSFKVPKVIE